MDKIRSGEGTGCEIPAVLGQMSIKVSVNAGMMDIEIKHNKDIKTCMSKVHLSNLGYSGYLGITAANRAQVLSSIDVQRIQVWNMSPMHYKVEQPNDSPVEDTQAVDLMQASHESGKS